MTTEALFPVPIYWGMIENDIVQQRFKEVHKTLSEQGRLLYKDGWNKTQRLSSADFSDNLIEEFNLVEFREELVKHLSIFLTDIGRNPGVEQVKIVSSWMTSNKKGDYSHQHCHGATDISGVYYVDTIEGDAKFYFNSSNKAQSGSYIFNHMTSTRAFEPTQGMIILFPGWLEHAVERQLIDHERVSVSFNLEFIRQHLHS